MYREKTVMVQGVPTSYRVQDDWDNASAEIVLLLHGWGSNKESFSAVQNNITHSIAVDMPGFGKTPLCSPDWGVEDYAQFVADFCLAVGIQQLSDVLGHSFGGRVATAMVIQGRIDIAKITLVGTPIYRKEQKSAGLLLSIARRCRDIPMMNRLRQWYYRQYLEVEDYVDAEQSGLSDIFKKTIEYCVGDYADDITVPVRLLWGAQDTTVLFADAKQFSQERGCVCRNVPGGHFPFVDSPQEFVEAYHALD